MNLFFCFLCVCSPLAGQVGVAELEAAAFTSREAKRFLAARRALNGRGGLGALVGDLRAAATDAAAASAVAAGTAEVEQATLPPRSPSQSGGVETAAVETDSAAFSSAVCLSPLPQEQLLALSPPVPALLPQQLGPQHQGAQQLAEVGALAAALGSLQAAQATLLATVAAQGQVVAIQAQRLAAMEATAAEAEKAKAQAVEAEAAKAQAARESGLEAT